MRTPYLIAEIGVNHDGDRARAVGLAQAAAAAGFDAVKLQHWVVEELLAPSAPNAAYQGEGDQHQLLAPLLLSVADQVAVRDACRAAGVDYGCTPDGPLAYQQVIGTEPDFMKIGSGDADNPWLLDLAVTSDIPLIISTGMATDAEVGAIAGRVAAHPDVTFLHCVSAYPTPLAASNLARMTRLAALTNRPVGWSDHTLGVDAAVAAVALGAVVIEKHVTDDVTRPGPDHAMSLPLAQAAEWVTTVRAARDAVTSEATEQAELDNRQLVRKALYPVRELPAGHVLAEDDLVALRPLLDGLPAMARDRVVGRALARPVSASEPVRDGDLR